MSGKKDLRVLLLIVVYYFIHCIGYTESAANNEARLVENLLEGYSRRARPVLRSWEPLAVRVSFVLKKIESLEEKEQIMSSFGWIKLTWKDEFLRWRPENYGKLSQITLPIEEVWTPELSLYNSVDEGSTVSDRSQYKVQVQHTGDVTFLPSMKWRTFCMVDLRYFPFDKQACNVTFANWNSNGSVVLRTSGISTTLYEPHDTWELVGRSIGSGRRPHDDQLGSGIPEVYFTVQLERRPTYYISATIIPCVVVSIMSGMAFLLPVESGEKVSLAITVSLSYTVLLLMISEITPKSGGSMPYLLNFMVFNMCQTALGLMMTVLVLSIYHHSPGKRPPACMRLVVLKFLGTLIGMCHLSKTCSYDRCKTGSSKINRIRSTSVDSSVVSMHKDEAGGGGGVGGPAEKEGGRLQLPESVLEFLEQQTERAREAARLGENREEWQALARVTDRVCLIVMLGLTLFGIMAFMVSMTGDPLF